MDTVTRARVRSAPGSVAAHDLVGRSEQVNERAFHVAEMALTTLAMAIEAGRPMIGLPVVLNRDFHYRSLLVRTGAGITEPAQLRGRRVGVRA